MSAPTSGSSDGSSIPGYYPDPSIPNYIRYWNGAAWVPGTSRPAPAEGEPLPAPPPGVAVVHPGPASSNATQMTTFAPDVTGPMFLDQSPAEDEPGGPALPQTRPRGAADAPDAPALPGARQAQDPRSTPPAPVAWDDPQRLHGSRPEPATAWQADAGRQAGFGGDQDQRVAWGSDAPRGAQLPDPRQGGAPDPGAAGAGTRPAAGDAAGGPARQSPPARQNPALPPARAGAPGAADRPGAPEGAGPKGGPDGTLTLRAVQQGAAPGAGAAGGASDGRGEGTMTIRAVAPDAAGPETAPPGGGTATAPGSAQPARAGSAAPGTPSTPIASAPPAPTAAPGPAAAPGVPGQGGAPGAPQGWAQQVQQLAQQPAAGPAAGAAGPAPGAAGAAGGPGTAGAAGGPGAPEGVIPWKPPVDNPFLQAAQAQGRPAPLGRRLLARLIDTVLLLAVVGAAAVPLWTKGKDHVEAKIDEAKLTGKTVTVYVLDGTIGAYLGILLGVLLVAGVLYEALPTAKWGRTLGKKLCGLRTLDIESHSTPSFAAALRRWLVYGLLGAVAVGVVNVLWCLFDRPWRQCWHDKAARTFVATDS